MSLEERDQESKTIDILIRRAAAGHGSLAVLEGGAGIGKTALVRLARDHAEDAGLKVLSAVCGELEQDLAFSSVRQLLGPMISQNGSRCRDDLLEGAARLAAPVFGLVGEDGPWLSNAVYGLYWLCSNMAEQGPVAMFIDDAHWADVESMRFLSHLARRVTDLPVVVVLATRPHPGNVVSQALSGLEPVRIPLAALSEEATERLARSALSAIPAPSFVRACHAISGGIPFYLVETLTSLRSQGVRPDDDEVWRLTGLSPDSVVRNVLERTRRVGDLAERVSQAAAVLGDEAWLSDVARLAEVDLGTCYRVVDALVQNELLTADDRVAFVHPLIRAAFVESLGGTTRVALHKRAAILLAERGRPADELAPHLLAAAKEADVRVVRWLEGAAESALSRGSPQLAARYLSRALAEGVVDLPRGALLTRLVRLQGMSRQVDEALETCRQVLALVTEPRLKLECLLEGWTILMQQGRVAEAMQFFRYAQQISDEDGDRLEVPGDVTAIAAAVGGFTMIEPPAGWLPSLERVAGGLSGATEHERLAMAVLAFSFGITGDGVSTATLNLARRAAHGPLPRRNRSMVLNAISGALMLTDCFAEVTALFDRGFAAAQHDGDEAEFRYLSLLRSYSMLFEGRLREAEADARAALDSREAEPGVIPLAAAVLSEALVAQGAIAEAQQVATAYGLEDEHPLSMILMHVVLLARGRLRLAQGRPEEALTDLRDSCGVRLAAAGYTNPAFNAWRSEGATALVMMGRGSEAEHLAMEELELARKFGAQRPIGMALRALARSQPTERAIPLLQEAVATLEGCSAVLELARAKVDLGAAVRRSGQRAAAVPILQHGRELAAACYALGLTERAHQELLAAGSRPRRISLHGIDALTASELRVARLAATGRTNRELAQSLFVSRRTVEIHLSRVYRKLGVTGRHELGDKLVDAER